RGGTHITFLVGGLAMAGMPPFSGFFSKDEILAAAFNKNPVLWGVGVLTAFMTAFYMFRLYAMTFLGKFRGTGDQEHHLHESPAAITFPLIILAILSVIGGWIGIPEVFMHGGHRLEEFLEPIFAQSYAINEIREMPHTTEYALMAVTIVGSIIALIYALNKFKRYQKSVQEETGIGKVLANKWYIDELYDGVIVRPLQSLAAFFTNVVEKNVIDGFVNGVGKAVNYGSRQVRLIQSGRVGTYVMLMVFGILILFIIQLFL
ncbi:MAG: proton-conducting transporter membrane subunit, partial [Ferruginibacter sp.]